MRDEANNGHSLPAESADPWQRYPLTWLESLADSPLPAYSSGQKAILNAVRAKPFGATAGLISEISGISYSHTLRSLKMWEAEECVQRSSEYVLHGYELRRCTLWSRSRSDYSMLVFSHLRSRPIKRAFVPDDQIPQHFWRHFWSGTSADQLRISEHAVHIAFTLLSSKDVCARVWVVNHLPTDALRECRAMRGFDQGDTAELLDMELGRRERAV